MATAIVQPFFCIFRVIAPQINLVHSVFLHDKTYIVQSTKLSNNRSSGVLSTAKKYTLAREAHVRFCITLCVNANRFLLLFV